VSAALSSLLSKEGWFLVILTVGALLAGSTFHIPGVAMWVGFALAGYSAVANDSIQTLGTFIASNRHRPWWLLWLFVGGIFVVTMTWGWMTHGGDVSYGRLTSKGFDQAPTSFHFLQIAAPLFLMVLTRLRMPVSTTFLLLSSFATSGKSLTAMAAKSLSGYVLAFGLALALWMLLGKRMKEAFQGPPGRGWVPAQWLTSGFLWSVWLQQDAANIAVYLPRQLDVGQFALFTAGIFAGLGLLLAQGGDRIQEVVDEKSGVTDVRSATVIDLLYGVILYVFKIWSKIPMSTTWVFIGLLSGRELGMSLSRSGDHDLRSVTVLILRDLARVTVGFLVSLILAAIINPTIRQGLFEP